MKKHETIDPFSTFTIMRHGVSITDACLGWHATERMLRQGHEALAKGGSGVRRNGMTAAALKVMNENARPFIKSVADPL